MVYVLLFYGVSFIGYSGSFYDFMYSGVIHWRCIMIPWEFGSKLIGLVKSPFSNYANIQIMSLVEWKRRRSQIVSMHLF